MPVSTFNASATIDQTIQIGQEATPGAGGSANRKLDSMEIAPSDDITTKSYRPQGHRHTSVVTEDMAMSSFDVSGPLDFRETLYAIENIFGAATPTLVPSTTKTYQRIYTIPLTGKLTPKTWIGQWGDANNVNQMLYMLLTGIGMKHENEASPMLSGCKGIAQPKTTGVTFTVSPVNDGIQPVVRTQTNYYVDSSGANLGVTQITDEILTSEWSYDGVYGPRWASNRSFQSFAGHVDLAPKASAKLSIAEGTFARSLNVGQTYFLRIDDQGPIIETTHTFGLTVDMAVKLTKPTKWGDAKGVYMRDMELEMVEDATWGNALIITSITDLATL